uniref:hypothetical protein n=1 Tax=Cytobacillus sp. Bac17 TaxID=2926008 RepID=UPI0021189851
RVSPNLVPLRTEEAENRESESEPGRRSGKHRLHSKLRKYKKNRKARGVYENRKTRKESGNRK